ncbi:NAD(P)H dehydrogenase [Burkholderiaceae bacterium 16]|nr:NAD(P)H dehydrogenase [Burkholderiaceae bacterium 16]
MTHLLHIDASARPGRSGADPHGSHTRRLSHRFVRGWQTARPTDTVTYRDVGRQSPAPVSGDWIRSAFTPPARREPWMDALLAESDRLIEEIEHADVVVIGVPMYNFGMPAQLKAYIDNIVRVGKTFGFDREREGEPYWPMLAGGGKQLVLLTSRGDYGYADRLARLDHATPGVRAAFSYIGIDDALEVAIEYDEFGGDRLAASVARAEAEVDAAVASAMRRMDGMADFTGAPLA